MTAAKRVLFSALLVVFLLSFLEVVSSLYYYLVVTGQSREMLEPLLGITGPGKLDILRYRPHPYFNYVFNPDYRYTDGLKPYNSRGFRAPEWKSKERGTVRVVAVGGSTTYGIFSRDGENIWPTFLERRLNAPGAPAVEVLNLGVTGYTSFEMMGVMAMMVPELEPDIVLLSVGTNDAFAACYPDEGGLDNTLFRFSWDVQRLPGIVKAAMKRSYTLRVAGFLAMSVDRYLPGDMMNAIQYPHPGDADALRNAANASGKYFRRNLRTLVALAKSSGAAVVVFTQPLNPAWDAVTAPFPRGVVDGHQRINEIIREVGASSGAVVIDLFSGMRQPELFVDAVHGNLRGEILQSSLVYPDVNALVAAARERARAGSPPPR